MLYTGCILVPSQKDRLRLSVMSRHTLSDGITPDQRLNGLYDRHWKLLSPSPALAGSYYRRGLSWDDFKERYIAEMQIGEKSKQVDTLIELATGQDVIVLCIEKEPWHCHRYLLALECNRRNQELPILIA